jgi:hypothetical protein
MLRCGCTHPTAVLRPSEMDVSYYEEEWTESGHALLVFSVIFIQTHAFDQVINFSRLALQSAVFLIILGRDL